MSVFTHAGQAAVLRSSQKDELYLQHLRSETSNIFRNSFGVRKWLEFRNYLDIVSDFAYFSLTTLSGLQTLGEEYVNIVQTDSTLKRVPSLQARFLSTASYVSFPFAFQLALQQLEKKVQGLPRERLPELLRSQSNYNLFLSALPFIRRNVPVFLKVHSLLFYIFGSYFHVSKRIFSIHYVLLRSWLQNDSFKKMYRLLGLMSFVQFVIGVSIELVSQHSKWEQLNESSNSSGTLAPVDSRDKCPLCLSKRQATTSTPCGHLFCWTCITNWIHKKEECPLCREKFHTSRLIFLQNFD